MWPRLVLVGSLLCIVSPLFPACGTSSAPDETKLTLVTWNVGLATGFVDYASQRLPIIVDTLRALDADVLCLQEVWTPEDVLAIRDGVADIFPNIHQVQLEDTSVGEAACAATESDPLVACVDTHCAAIAASEIAGCVLEHCRPEFDALGDNCTTCVVANIGKEVDEIVSLCKTGSARFAYKGANGLMLLSRRPLSNLAHVELESTNTQRSLLAANVSLPVLGEVAVICTHLAADLTSSGLTYTGPFETWGGENAVQADAVIAFAESYAASRSTIILGDFNSGPGGSPPLEPELPDAAFLRLSQAGYTAFPSSLGEGQTCTYCAENLLVDDSATSVLIDHLFFDAIPADVTIATSRVGVKPFEINVGDSLVPTHASDHFGVELSLQESP